MKVYSLLEPREEDPEVLKFKLLNLFGELKDDVEHMRKNRYRRDHLMRSMCLVQEAIAAEVDDEKLRLEVDKLLKEWGSAVKVKNTLTVRASTDVFLMAFTETRLLNGEKFFLLKNGTNM